MHTKTKHTETTPTSDAQFVELTKPLVKALTRHIVTQTDSGEWDKAEVEGLQKVPVLF